MQLVHHVLVDLQAACCIEDDNIVSVLLSIANRILRNVRRQEFMFVVPVDINSDLLRIDLQLLHGSRSVDIKTGQERPVTSALELRREFCGCGCLTGAVQSHHHDDSHRGLWIQFQVDHL